MQRGLFRVRQQLLARTVGRVLPLSVGLIWVMLLGAGARTLFIYESTPGIAAAAPRVWPAGSRSVRPDNRYTLVIFAHPDCPCTRASLAELEIAVAQLQGKLNTLVWFRKPAARIEEARESSLWKTAAGIPDVSVDFDVDGSETALFGAEVSGQVMLYSPAGKLLFSGGITDRRGHQGDNAGLDAVVLHVNGKDAPDHAPVFGCSLRDLSAEDLREDSSWKKQ